MSDKNKMLIEATQDSDGNQSVTIGITDNLPNPILVEHWNQLVPTAAREILTMARDEQKNRHANDRSERWSKLIGQLTSFVIILVGLIGAIVLIREGRPIEGLTMFFGPLATLAGVVWMFRKPIESQIIKK